MEEISYEARRKATNEILEKMNSQLTGNQLYELNKVLNESFNNVIFTYKCEYINLDYENENNYILHEFISMKTIEGLSPNTLKRYEYDIRNMFNHVLKHYNEITTEDIRDYFNYCKNKGVSNRTIDNYRRSLNSFFNTMSNNGYIFKNPMKRISPIKYTDKIKKAFSIEEIELMRDNIPKNNLRNRAIFELFLSSGIRLNELLCLNIHDLDLKYNSFKVLGKGNKERVCYMSEIARIHLQRYLNTRNDENPAVFISKRKKINEYGIIEPIRLTRTGVESLISKLGKRLNIKAHPHKFRRTFATKALKRGMPIEQVQKLLGHESIETTMIYVSIDQDIVKLNYEKFSN